MLPRGLVVLLGAACLVVTVAGVRAGAGILGPVLLGLVLTVAVHPLLGWAGRRGLPSWAAVLGTLVAVYAVLLALAASLTLSVARFATLLPGYADEAQGVLDDVAAFLQARGVGDAEVQRLLSGVDFTRLVGLAGDVVGSVTGLLSNLFLLVALLLFMALDAASFPSRLREAAAERPALVHALGSFARGTRRYLVVSTVFGLVVAVIDAGALWALGVPLPLVWGLLAFVTNYIPNIGFVLGLVPPALLALLEGGPGLLVLVVLVYSVVNVVIQSVIQPTFVGDAVGLSATLTFLSLVVWAWVLGPVGALLAVPLTLLVKALLVDMDPRTRWMSSFLAAPATTGRATS